MRRVGCLLGGTGGALLLAASAAWGQVDTTARDTVAAPDTAPIRLPTLPVALPPGPLPPGARRIFDVDSLAFSNIQTLSDLLAHIPGVYVARGGFYGQVEAVFYGGRGPLALELYWDGVPYQPLGRDSVYVDPARITLAPLERIEVLVLPASLRVHLVPKRQRSTLAGTEVGVLTGDVDIARYTGSFARRWRPGWGLALVADQYEHRGIGTSTGTQFRTADVWVKGEYVPSGRYGVAYEVLSSTWNRSGSADMRVDHWRAKRRDGIVRAFWARRDDGLGPRVTAAMATTSIERDTAVGRRSLRQGFLEATLMARRAHAAFTVRLADDRRPLELEASASWNPLRGVTIAADARRTRYDGSRDGRRAHLAAGVQLPLGFSARGDFAWARDLQAPALDGDTLLETTDVGGAVRWEQPWVMLEVAGGKRDAFWPAIAPAGLKSLARLDSTLATRYRSVHASLRPLPGVELAGWYFEPLEALAADFEPPKHGRYSATFYSKFWRVFRSGIFALRGEVAVESWSSGGRAGRDSLNGPLELKGSTFVETNLEMQIGDVTILWIIRNANGMRTSYVPGLDYPKNIQFFGARWAFRN